MANLVGIRWLIEQLSQVGKPELGGKIPGEYNDNHAKGVGHHVRKPGFSDGQWEEHGITLNGF